jgi:hypothetical protein
MDLVDRLEAWFERHYRIRPIGEGGYIMRMGLIRHRGRRVTLEDGTVVNPGDPVVELHMDNRRAAGLHDTGKGGIRFRREVFRALPALARDLETLPEYREINAICGASLVWKEARRAGFESRPFPAFTRWWLGWWERHLMAHFHPAGRRRLAVGNRTELRQIWISRRTLVERYGTNSGAAQEARGRGVRIEDGSVEEAHVEGRAVRGEDGHGGP